MNMDFSLANKLLYWLNDWSGYILPNEKSFKYNELIKYEQYSIFEANFGFNVGSEAGGLHYGVIIDKNNSKSSKILMVIPFKSLDEGETEDDTYKKLLKKKSYYETEISKMSRGTIAQVGQMCLMSKMRIYYPTSTSEKLYGIKLSPENIKKIKEKFDELYF